MSVPTSNRHHLPRAALLAIALLSGATFASGLRAQVDRFELGLRLRSFERALAAQTEPARRDAAFVALDRGVQAFFRLDVSAVAEALADAEAALAARAPTADERFAASLQLTLDRRLLTTGDLKLPLTLRPSWRSDAERPPQLTLQVEIAGFAGSIDAPVAELPTRLALPWLAAQPGDHELRWRLCAGTTPLAERSTFVSVVADRDDRLAGLDAAAKTAGADLEGRTLVALTRMLRSMLRGSGEETVLPGARLLVEAEQLAQAIAAGESFYGPGRPGQYWLRVPTASTTFAVRLLVPPPADAPQPLVLALHGAGGSENLFFDSYGAGEAVRLCAQRGWYLCAPRAGLGVPDLPALVDALAQRYPIDRRRVFVVGHSMGAAMAVGAATAHPDRFAGCAALGGGGDAEGKALRQVPFLVAAGSRDFLRGAATQLRDRLRALEVPVEWRQYDGVEHLAIVQIALPDVFAWFDRLAAR